MWKLAQTFRKFRPNDPQRSTETAPVWKSPLPLVRADEFQFREDEHVAVARALELSLPGAGAEVELSVERVQAEEVAVRPVAGRRTRCGASKLRFSWKTRRSPSRIGVLEPFTLAATAEGSWRTTPSERSTLSVKDSERQNGRRFSARLPCSDLLRSPALQRSWPVRDLGTRAHGGPGGAVAPSSVQMCRPVGSV
jgi:hypothetical protein